MIEMADSLDSFQEGFERTDVARATEQLTQSQKSIRMKVITLGDAGVGKSALIRRFWKDKFSAKYVSTIGVDYGVLNANLDGREIKVNFWDFSGHAEFLEVRNEFYQDSQGALLVYDVTSRRSFEALDAWMREAKKFGASSGMAVVVIANKCDAPKEKHVVPRELIDAWVSTSGFKLFECSAQSGVGVSESFEFLFTETLNNVKRLEEIARLGLGSVE